MFLFILIFSASYSAISQTMVDKYCEIEAKHKNGFTSDISIRVLTGEVDSLFSFKDPSVIRELNKLNEFKTVPDALNFIATQGWTFVAVTSVGGGALEFFFRKSFDKSKLN
jgi:hypothetical protein